MAVTYAKKLQGPEGGRDRLTAQKKKERKIDPKGKKGLATKINPSQWKGSRKRIFLGRDKTITGYSLLYALKKKV